MGRLKREVTGGAGTEVFKKSNSLRKKSNREREKNHAYLKVLETTVYIYI